MNIYTCEFNGVYPIGAVALVVAETIDIAEGLLNAELAELGLIPVERADIKLQNNRKRRVDILLNGDY